MNTDFLYILSDYFFIILFIGGMVFVLISCSCLAIMFIFDLMRYARQSIRYWKEDDLNE